jgi:hypothetical protein
MKKIFLFLFILSLLGFSTDTFSQARRFVLIEHFTQASCAPCAQQNPFLQTILDVNRGSVHHVAYHTSWPGVDPMNTYNAPEVAARVSYYGVTGVPDCFMLGNQYHGGPAGVSQNMLNDASSEPSPIRVNVKETSNGTVRTVKVKVYTVDTVPSANYKIRVAVNEQWVHYATPPGSNGEKDFPDVFRKMLPNTTGDAYTPAAIGDSVTFTYTYTLDLTHWDTAQIYSLAFIQNETTKEVLNSGSSFNPGYELVPVDPCFQAGTSGDVKQFHFKLINFSNTAQNFRVKLTEGHSNDWTRTFTIGSNSYQDSTDLLIPAKTTIDVVTDITITTQADLENYTFSMKSLDNINYDPQTLNFYVIADVYELIVNNDGSWGDGSNTSAEDFQQNYIDGLTYAGSTNFSVTRLGAVLKAQKFSCLTGVVNYYFNVGWSFPGISTQAAALYTSELNAGKNLFISGQDIGWDVWDPTSGHSTPEAKTFYTNFLNAQWLSDGGTADNKLIANTEDTIFGLIPTSNVVNVYGGAYFYPDEIKAIGNGTEIFYYDAAKTKQAGVRAFNGTWKTVYLAPSLEMVQDVSTRKEIIKVSHDWFGGTSSGVQTHGNRQPDFLLLNYPNPAGDQTTILLNRIDGPMTIELLDVSGRSMNSYPVSTGMKEIKISTSELAGGLYFYRLVSEGRILGTKRMQVIH